MDWALSLLGFSCPSLLVRFFWRRDYRFVGILQDLFAGAQLGALSLVAPYFVPVLQMLIFYDGHLDRKLQLRLEGHCFPLLFQLKSFKDSAKALHVFSLFPLFLLGGLSSLLLKPLSLYWLLLGFPFLYLQTDLGKDHLLILWEKRGCAPLFRLFKKTRKNFLFFAQKELISSQEIYTSKAADYPLFRYTHGFKGEKTCDIALRAKEKPHVIFLFLESLRGRDVGALGGRKGVTPCLDALAKESHLFRQFFANSYPTVRAFYTSLFGLPYTLDLTFTLNKNVSTYGLPQLMQDQGYQTNFFSGADWDVGGIGPFLKKIQADLILDKGDLRDLNPEIGSGSWGIDDEHLFNLTIDHLEKSQGLPQFYSLFTITSHHPWIVPSHHTPPPLEDVQNKTHRNYLQTIHYVDNQVGNFVQKLKEKNLSKEVILFVMGDHGVVFGEETPNLKYLSGVNNDYFHVPLMIYADGRINQPQVIDERASQCDLLPTLMDLLQMKGFQHSIGRSLLRKDKKCTVFCHSYCREVGALRVENHQGGGEINQSTGEFKGSNPQKAPLLHQFFEMFTFLYSKNRLVPENFRREEEPLFVELLAITGKNSKEEIEALLAEKSPAISLNIKESHLITEELALKIAEKNPDLHDLHIASSCSLTDKALSVAMGKLQKLRFLSLTDCFLLTEKCLETFPSQLNELHLRGVDFVNDESFTRKFKHLEKINLQEVPLTGKGLLRFPNLFPSLFHLTLSYTHLDIFSIQKVLEKLPIVELSLLDGESLTDKEALSLLQSSSTLRKLKLTQCEQLTDTFFEQIKETTLQELYLSNVPLLTDRGLEAILKLPIDTLYIDGAPNLSHKANELINRHKSKFLELAVRFLAS